MMNIVSSIAAPTSSAAQPLDKPHAALKKATEQFESYFLHQLLVEMRKTVPKDTLTGDSDNRQAIFTDMLDQNMADTLSARGDLGIAHQMYNQMQGTLPTAPVKTQTDQK